MKDKWGNERENTIAAMLSYVPVKFRIILFILTLFVIVIVECPYIFLKKIWSEGLKIAFTDAYEYLQGAFVDFVEHVNMLWCCEEDPLKPKHEEKTENE